MEPIPNRPSERVIAEAADTDGVTLSWAVRESGAARCFGAAFMTFWLCLWAAGWVTAARAVPAFLGGRGFAPLFGLVVLGWLGAWTYAGWLAVRMLWRVLWSGWPESVRLEAERLRYDLGHGPCDAVRSAIRAFVLDRPDGRQRLYFDCGAERVEIGAGLREPEREWLFAVLERWLAAPAEQPEGV